MKALVKTVLSIANACTGYSEKPIGKDMSMNLSDSDKIVFSIIGSVIKYAREAKK